MPPVAGIGASAGGVEALQALFAALPADTGVAFVVVVHLSPEHESQLAPILARASSLPVEEVHGERPLEPDRVYVIPPGRALEITDSHVGAVPFEAPRGRRAPIDAFFRSLAREHGDGFAIVLSGGDADGAAGVRAIKEGGGLVLVQEPAEAAFDAMPRAAIATGTADLVMPVRDLAARIGELAATKRRLRERLGPAAERPLEEGEEAALQRILAHLRVRTGHDFARYKRPTLLRRVARRMQMTQRETLDAYHAYLRGNVEEAQTLFDDLLITVTTFFRDPEAWSALVERAIPRLFDDRPVDTPVRAWVPGCATGEEAYTLAMLLIEEAERRERWPEVQVFASDLDEGALATAREGLYPATIEADVSAARLGRFFVREDDHYRVSKALRERVLFASHSLVKDPPFIRLDLISCRNLLIYLERDVQAQVFGIFRYALHPDGYLFLGSAESAEPEYFETLEKGQRLFRVRAAEAPPSLPELVMGGPHAHPLATFPARASRPPAAPARIEEAETLAPPSALVDERFECQRLLEGAGRYLEPADGAVTRDLTAMVRPELRAALRAALHRAFERGEGSLGSPIPVRFNGAAREVSLWVRPRRDAAPRQALVVFVEGGEAADEDGSGPAEGGDEALAGRHEHRLREELRLSEARLRTADEDHESAIEELRAANEEFQSINEEYRSTAEELETSKEELQSINEELNTVNLELKHKLEEVSRAHDDLENLMAATEIGTLFLDRELRIQRFTPALAELFNVKAVDRGRPIADFTHHLDYHGLAADAREVIASLAPLEREARHEDGRGFAVRLRPYRTAEDRIDGVVATFVDVTERQRDARALREAHEFAEHIIGSLHEALLVLTPELVVKTANATFHSRFGLAADEVEGRPLFALDGGRWDVPELRRQLEEVLPGDEAPDSFELEWELVPEDVPGGRPPRERRVLRVNARRLDDTAEILLAIEDVTERVRAERALRDSEARLRAVLASLPAVVPFAADAGGRLRYVSPGLADYAGLAPADALGRALWDGELLHPEDRAHTEAAWIEARERDRPFEMRHRIRAAGGDHRWAITRARRVDGAERAPEPEWYGAIADVDELTRAETALREADRHRNRFLGLLGHELRNPLGAIGNGLEALGALGEAERATIEAAGVPVGRTLAGLERQCRHMTRLMDDLLDLTRISNGKVALRTRALALNARVEEAVEAFGPRLEAASHALELDLPERSSIVEADPDRLAQMLGNLLDNAIKYTDAGGRIELGVVERGREAIVSVRDDGIGIAPEALARLFEPFTQVLDPDRPGPGGLGLGLALIRSLAELHGGAVEAESAGPGRGSEFRLRLPLADGAPEDGGGDEDESGGRAVPVARARAPLASRRVLIVDDTSDIADPFAALLRAIGQRVEVAYDGDAALAVAADFAPEVAFLDLGMPGMDGFELARRLRRDAPRSDALVLVAVTGYGQAEDVMRAREAGFDHHLLKPLRLDTVRELLARLEAVRDG